MACATTTKPSGGGNFRVIVGVRVMVAVCVGVMVLVAVEVMVGGVVSVGSGVVVLVGVMVLEGGMISGVDVEEAWEATEQPVIRMTTMLKMK